MAGTNYRFWDSRLEIMFSLVFRRSDLFCDPLTSAYVMFVLKAGQCLLKSNHIFHVFVLKIKLDDH